MEIALTNSVSLDLLSRPSSTCTVIAALTNPVATHSVATRRGVAATNSRRPRCGSTHVERASRKWKVRDPLFPSEISGAWEDSSTLVIHPATDSHCRLSARTQLLQQLTRPLNTRHDLAIRGKRILTRGLDFPKRATTGICLALGRVSAITLFVSHRMTWVSTLSLVPYPTDTDLI